MNYRLNNVVQLIYKRHHKNIVNTKWGQFMGYRGKPTIAIQLNALLQMSYRLQRTRKLKKTWKQGYLIACTFYKGNLMEQCIPFQL